MWKWLRSWFAWRFSLGRLVIATVFLGAFVGLNCQKIGPSPKYIIHPGGVFTIYARGWPLPFLKDTAVLQFRDMVRIMGTDPYSNPTPSAEEDWFLLYPNRIMPLTHQSYRLLRWQPLEWLGDSKGRIVCVILDALFALSVLALILFLQIPRRKEPSPPLAPPAADESLADGRQGR